MAALRIGLLVIDGVTLADVTPVRERLTAMGAQVTILVPTGGTILPVSGRYYPAAGGHGERKALCQVSSVDFDLLLFPDSITAEQVARYPQILAFVRGQAVDSHTQPVPVFSVQYLTHLLEHGINLDGLARPVEKCTLSGSRRGR